MCRNIKNLFNFDPPATDQEIHDAALQYVRKLSGFNRPTKGNEDAFNRAVEEIAAGTRSLLQSLSTTSTAKNREIEAQKARVHSAKRFGTSI